ncbi:MAG: response regulator [Bdellovibrionota bacterium]|nr:response regulator [Deltaproteobacteria bacterium]
MLTSKSTDGPDSGAIFILALHTVLNENKWLTLFIEKYHLHVELATDGQDLYDKAIALQPDVVITTAHMDGISGLNCFRMIREKNAHVRTILLSMIDSKTMARAANELNVDLYCGRSRRAIKVLRFLKQAMGVAKVKKETVKFARARTISDADLGERLKDRYPVSGAITMIFDGQEYPGVFENISLGGAKIRVPQIPPLPSPIELKWAFKGSTSFHVHAVTVRQNMVFEPWDEYVWVVGVRFTKLTAQQIKELSDLIQKISKFYERKFDFVDFEQIRKMLLRQERYFKPMLHGQKAPVLIEKALRQIKDYERASFMLETKKDHSIAKLLSFRIVCRVLRQSLNWVEIHPEEGLKLCVPLIYDVLEKVDAEEENFDEMIRDSDTLETRKQLVESSNSMLEEKDKLIQSFHDHCHAMIPSDSYKYEFNSIILRHQDLQSYQNFVEPETEKKESIAPDTRVQQTLYKLSRKTREAQKENLLEKNRQEELQKIRENIVPTIATGIVLITVLNFILNFYHSFVDVEDVRLTLAAQKVRIKQQNHVVVQTDARTWDALEVAQKNKVLDELEVFLTARQLYQAKVMDGDELIAVVYSTHNREKLLYGYDVFR